MRILLAFLTLCILNGCDYAKEKVNEKQSEKVENRYLTRYYFFNECCPIDKTKGLKLGMKFGGFPIYLCPACGNLFVSKKGHKKENNNAM